VHIFAKQDQGDHHEKSYKTVVLLARNDEDLKRLVQRIVDRKTALAAAEQLRVKEAKLGKHEAQEKVICEISGPDCALAPPELGFCRNHF
jgi:DNA polymerase III alpha subunit